MNPDRFSRGEWPKTAAGFSPRIASRGNSPSRSDGRASIVQASRRGAIFSAMLARGLKAAAIVTRSLRDRSNSDLRAVLLVVRSSFPVHPW